MKKLQKYFTCLLMILWACMGFVSCDSDSDNMGNNPSEVPNPVDRIKTSDLVGTWIHESEFNGQSYVEVLTLNANKKGTWYYRNPALITNYSINWQYDENLQVLTETIYAIDGQNTDVLKPNKYKIITANEDLSSISLKLINFQGTEDPYGPVTSFNKKGGSQGGSGSGGDSGSGSGSTENTTVTQVEVAKIWVSSTSSYSDISYVSMYKWVLHNQNNKVVLSTSKTNMNGAFWHVASSNTDREAGGYKVSSYSYVYKDYSPVGGAWYYYFN